MAFVSRLIIALNLSGLGMPGPTVHSPKLSWMPVCNTIPSLRLLIPGRLMWRPFIKPLRRNSLLLNLLDLKILLFQKFTLIRSSTILPEKYLLRGTGLRLKSYSLESLMHNRMLLILNLLCLMICFIPLHPINS